VLDVTFAEDASRIRKGSSPEISAAFPPAMVDNVRKRLPPATKRKSLKTVLQERRRLSPPQFQPG
jgi:hypothetical protein